MSLLVLGLNHHTAPLELRERLTIDREQLKDAMAQLTQFAGQGVILSTCNRMEIYSHEEDETDLSGRLASFLSETSGITSAELDSHLYRYYGDECVKHLFRVTCGLDSMVVGEKQVLGQVRTAYSVASELGHVRGPLSGLFHQALRTARRIHRDTNIDRHSRSVSRAGVQLARGLLGDLAQQQVLVIGAGDAGHLVARALSDAGARKMVVTNRTYWRAENLAKDLGGVAVPLEDLLGQLAEADVVISSTGSPEYVLDQAMVQQAMVNRDQRPLLIIDIAVPRDIDPAVGGLDQVQLYDIDALQMVSESSAAGMRQDVDRAEAMVEDRTREFREWWDSLDVVPLIAAIRQQAEEIRRDEVAKTVSKIKSPWPDDTEKISEHLNGMTSALVKKLLHQPTVFFTVCWRGQVPHCTRATGVSWAMPFCCRVSNMGSSAAQPINTTRVPPVLASTSQGMADSVLDGSSLPLTTVKQVATLRWVTGMPE